MINASKQDYHWCKWINHDGEGGQMGLDPIPVKDGCELHVRNASLEA